MGKSMQVITTEFWQLLIYTLTLKLKCVSKTASIKKKSFLINSLLIWDPNSIISYVSLSKDQKCLPRFVGHCCGCEWDGDDPCPGVCCEGLICRKDRFCSCWDPEDMTKGETSDA